MRFRAFVLGVALLLVPLSIAGAAAPRTVPAAAIHTWTGHGPSDKKISIHATHRFRLEVSLLHCQGHMYFQLRVLELSKWRHAWNGGVQSDPVISKDFDSGTYSLELFSVPHCEWMVQQLGP